MIKVKVVNKSPYGLPAYAHPGDSGMDIKANIEEAITLQPWERYCFPTGIYLGLPEGYECQVRPRSGLALKKGITVLNTPGTVDEGYRGEVGVVLINLSTDPVTIEPGERIAQLVFAPVTKAELIETEDLDNTDRGDTGYGESGRF